jgi:hypothetical protein
MAAALGLRHQARVTPSLKAITYPMVVALGRAVLGSEDMDILAAPFMANLEDQGGRG